MAYSCIELCLKRELKDLIPATHHKYVLNCIIDKRAFRVIRHLLNGPKGNEAYFLPSGHSINVLLTLKNLKKGTKWPGDQMLLQANSRMY